MPIPLPIPNFVLAKTALSVQFTDLSLNNPTSWLWDFGDGTTSTLQNPLKVFPSEGYFVVSLSVTNVTGTSDPILELSVGVSNTNIQMGNYSIWFMSEQEVPSALRPEIDVNEKHSMIAAWQNYIWPLLNDNIIHPIDVVDSHNELLYDSLVNELIAKLVAYELIIQAANQFVTSSSVGASSSSSSSTSVKDIKKIETGPANVEWYPNAAADNAAAAAGALSAATKAGGTLDKLKEVICQYSKRLRVFIPFCGPLIHSPVSPSKRLPDCPKVSSTWPSFFTTP